MTGPVALVERAPAGAGPQWWQDLRQAHAARVRQSGLPTRRDESWKYTPLRSLEQVDFTLPDQDGAALAPEDLADLALEGLSTGRAVLVNGVFNAALSNLAPLGGADAVSIRSLADLDGDQLEQLRASLERQFEGRDTAFAALNVALASDGLVIEVADGAVVDRPLEILHLDLAADAPRKAAARFIVRLGRNARLTVVERFTSLGPATNLANALMQVDLATGSLLRHVRLQQLGADRSLVTRSEVTQHPDSTYRYFGMDLGGALVRHDIHASLEGRGAHCDLSGVYRLEGRSHVDNHTRVDHVAPGATSNEWFKGVLDGASRAVFNGKVVVHEGADGTDARQSNANLLLSPDSEVDTKPELEIYADDVKCAHGATVGQLDERQLYYLRSRGIDLETARDMLTRAFCVEVLGVVRDETLRRILQNALDADLEIQERTDP